jgi:hypothetical protein
MSRYMLVLILFCAFAGTTNATIQESSLLILEGQHIYSYNLPPLQAAFPDIKFPEFQWVSTGNRKGYRATWATFQNQLYIVGLQGQLSVKGKLLQNEDITKGYSFPLKVTSWSGKIVQTEAHSELDVETFISTDVKVITTITLKKGKVIDVKVREERKQRPDTDK